MKKNPFINPRVWKEYIRDLRQAYNKMVEEEGQMYKLIIIDDEKKILDGIAELFPWKNIGFEVVGKYTRAREALKYLENNRVDVVMTDVCMPDIDGLELTKELKQYQELRIVIFSSYSDYKYMREALKLEVADYLLKPISYGKLLECFEKIKEFLDKKYCQDQESEITYYEKIIKKVDSYLEQNFQEGSLVSAAELVGISPNYLSKIYKEKKGVGFSEYLNKIRMEKAGEMLMDPSYKSYEIAYYVGYDNPKNFTRAFKAYFHVTPRDYRNGIRGEEN